MASTFFPHLGFHPTRGNKELDATDNSFPRPRLGLWRGTLRHLREAFDPQASTDRRGLMVFHVVQRSVRPLYPLSEVLSWIGDTKLAVSDFLAAEPPGVWAGREQLLWGESPGIRWSGLKLWRRAGLLTLYVCLFFFLIYIYIMSTNYFIIYTIYVYPDISFRNDLWRLYYLLCLFRPQGEEYPEMKGRETLFVAT